MAKMDVFNELKNKIEEADLWDSQLTLTRNQYLTVKGSIETDVYFILKGSLRVYFEDEYEEQTIRLGYEQNLIAALDSFITGQATDLYIQAIKKCELKVISKAKLMELVQADIESLRLWQKLLELLIYQQLEREKDILTYSPLERYNRVLARSPQLFQHIPAKYIASYLRMSPETLSRLKKS